MTAEEDLRLSRRTILRYGENATAWQILNPGILRWHAEGKEGLVGYVQRGKTRVVAGNPVGPANQLYALAHAFEDLTPENRVCWFCADERFATILRQYTSHAVTLIGAQPVWRPESWVSKVTSHASLRAQLRRAENKGVMVTEWSTERAAKDSTLIACLAAWLRAHPVPPLRFLVEPRTLERPEGRRIFVATQGGRPIGYALLSPVPQQNGWLVEQLIRIPAAPNGTTELMVHHAVSKIAEEGSEYVTLGLAPLSHHCGVPGNDDPRLRFLLGWLRLHGRRFYNFRGLDFFKTKFKPDLWEPIYAIANEPRVSLATLWAIASAFSDGTPLRHLLGGLARAVGQEGRWLLERLRL